MLYTTSFHSLLGSEFSLSPRLPMPLILLCFRKICTISRTTKLASSMTFFALPLCQNFYQNQSTPSCFLGPPPSQCMHEHNSFTLVSFSLVSLVPWLAERLWAALIAAPGGLCHPRTETYTYSTKQYLHRKCSDQILYNK